MSAYKHTSGPWHHEVTNSAHTSYVVVSADGLANGSTVVIGQCAGPDRLDNARLIAAAPELLSSLQFAVKLLSALPHVNGTAQLDYMRAAIAKATGGAA